MPTIPPGPGGPDVSNLIIAALVDAADARGRKARTARAGKRARRERAANLELASSYWGIIAEIDSGNISVTAGGMPGALTLGADLARVTVEAVEDAIEWQEMIIQLWRNSAGMAGVTSYVAAQDRARRYRDLLRILRSARRWNEWLRPGSGN